jgi:kinesin family member C1
LSFFFPKIFHPTSKQEDLFNSIGISKTQDLIDGYNVCVFAYGQTGSGKTYTMFNMVKKYSLNKRMRMNWGWLLE